MRKGFFISILTCGILYGAYYWGIPALINLPAHTDFIEKTVHEAAGYKISLKNPRMKMGLLPAVYVKADNFSILNDDNSKAINIDKPFAGIELFPLIFKKLDIKKFSADNIEANLVYTKDKKFNLGQYEIEIPEKQLFKLNKLSTDINNLNIILDDKFQNKKINLHSNNLKSDFIEDKLLDLSVEAQLNSGKKTADLKTDINLKLPVNKISNDQLQISGELENLDISDFSEYAKTFSDGKIKALDGKINITADTETTDTKEIKTNLAIDGLNILMADEAASMKCNGKLSIESDISTIQNGLQINNLQVNADGIDGFVSGKITKLNSKIPNLDLKITVNNSKAENILALLPGIPDLDPDIDLYLLKKNRFLGKSSRES